MKKYFVRVLILKDRKFGDIIKFYNYRFYFRDVITKFHYIVNCVGQDLEFSFNRYSLVGEYYEKHYSSKVVK